MLPARPELTGDAPPERRLPALVLECRRGGVRLRETVGGPVGEPLLSIGDVVVEEGRDTQGEVVAHAIVRGVEIARERRVRLRERRVAENAKDAPGETRGREGRTFVDPGDHR